MSLSVELRESYREATTPKNEPEPKPDSSEYNRYRITERELRLLRKAPKYIAKRLGVNRATVSVYGLPIQHYKDLRHWYIRVDDIILCYRPNGEQHLADIDWSLLVIGNSSESERARQDSFLHAVYLGYLTRDGLAALIGNLFERPELTGHFLATSVSATDILTLARSLQATSA